MGLLISHTEKDILRLFHHIVTASYSRFAGQSYERTHDVAMGSAVSPVIENLFMENFEEMVLDQVLKSPSAGSVT
jgi:hypothetical protein